MGALVSFEWRPIAQLRAGVALWGRYRGFRCVRVYVADPLGSATYDTAAALLCNTKFNFPPLAVIQILMHFS